MTLHRQTNWFMLAAGAAVAVCLLLTLYASAQVRQASGQAAQAELAARAAGQLSYLAMETVLYRQPRTALQWRARTDSFAALLASQPPDTAARRALLTRQRSNLASLGRLHDKLGGSRAAPLTGTGSDATPATISALFLVAQEMEDDAFSLAHLSHEAVASAQQRLSALVLANVLLLGALIGAGSLAIRRRVLAPIATLKSAMEAVSAGQMEARANLPLANELGFLAAVFNQMTERLAHTQNQARQEIVQRQAAQQALQESADALARTRANIQAILDHMPALVVYWDAGLVNRFTNRASLEWLGLAPDMVQGMGMLDLVGQRRFALHEPRVASVLAGNAELFEAVVDLADGTLRNALFSYIPHVEHGIVKGFYGVISDVTALRHAQASQQEALAQLRSVVDAADDFAIMLTDDAGSIRLYSAGAERMLGYRADDMAGSTPERLHDGAELALRRSALGADPALLGYGAVIAPVRNGGSDTREWHWRHQDGSEVPVSLTISAVRDDGGQVIGYLCLAKNIGVEKRRQRELIEARDAAQAASQAKSMFLANMSHEIRTPMNAVIGMLDLLGYTGLDAVQADYVAKTSGAARSLLALLNDILDLSRIEADGLTLETAEFELTGLVGELSGMLGALAGDKPLELIFMIDPELPPRLCGDALRLRQVLINLASNAIKFTPRGEVRLAIRRSAHGLVEFCVSDTGIGISASKLGTIFEQFSQAEESTTRRFGGTGLGLAISQRLVALMGGQLLVDSTLGEGSSFSFTLALPAALTGATALPAAPVRAGLRVLIVDDHASAREVLVGMVEALGWQADCAADGATALQILDGEARYDVILVDWRMPGMDGFELTGKLAARPEWRGGQRPVIIMVTAAARAELSGQMANASLLPHGFLIKPVTAPMLVDAIREASVPARAALPVIRATTALSGLRVLLVDDNPLNQQVARELLSKRGAVVSVADGGTMAVRLALAPDAAFDAVLMDIQMPDMDGYQAARMIRADPRGAALPILAMTANAMQGDRELSLAAGMNDHLNKPIDIGQVVQALLHHCGRAGAGAVALRPPAAAAPTAVNFAPALDRLGGDRSVYFSLSGIFATESAAMIDELAACFSDQAWLRAADRLHSYKSAAGMLGADRLQQLAGALEQRLRSDPAGVDCAAALAAVRADVATITAELSLIEQANRPPPRAALPAGSLAQLAASLDQLDRLLGQSSMRALTEFDTLQDTFGALLGERMRPLAAAIAALDFKHALACSEILRKETL